MTWAERAEEFTTGMGELGAVIAATHAAGWRARVEEDAIAALAGAALALYAPTSALVSAGKPYAKDRQLMAAVEERDIEVSEMHRAAAAMWRDCSAALSRAQDAHAALVARLRKAQAGESDEQRMPLEAQIRELEELIADCEVALEILEGAAGRLAWAIKCLRRVPEDLSEVYETAYLHLRFRGRLPRDGDFLTGTPAQPHHAIAR